MTLLSLMSLQSYWALAVTLGLIALDAGIGIVVAMAKGQFSLAKVGQFVHTHILPQLGGLALAAVTQYFGAQSLGALGGGAVTTIFWGVVAAVNLSLLRDILVKFGVRAAILSSLFLPPKASSGSQPPASSGS